MAGFDEALEQLRRAQIELSDRLSVKTAVVEAREVRDLLQDLAPIYEIEAKRIEVAQKKVYLSVGDDRAPVHVTLWAYYKLQHGNTDYRYHCLHILGSEREYPLCVKCKDLVKEFNQMVPNKHKPAYDALEARKQDANTTLRSHESEMQNLMDDQKILESKMKSLALSIKCSEQYIERNRAIQEAMGKMYCSITLSDQEIKLLNDIKGEMKLDDFIEKYVVWPNDGPPTGLKEFLTGLEKYQPPFFEVNPCFSFLATCGLTPTGGLLLGYRLPVNKKFTTSVVKKLRAMIKELMKTGKFYGAKLPDIIRSLKSLLEPKKSFRDSVFSKICAILDQSKQPEHTIPITRDIGWKEFVTSIFGAQELKGVDWLKAIAMMDMLSVFSSYKDGMFKRYALNVTVLHQIIAYARTGEMSDALFHEIIRRKYLLAVKAEIKSPDVLTEKDLSATYTEASVEKEFKRIFEVLGAKVKEDVSTKITDASETLFIDPSLVNSGDPTTVLEHIGPARVTGLRFSPRWLFIRRMFVALNRALPEEVGLVLFFATLKDSLPNDPEVRVAGTDVAKHLDSIVKKCMDWYLQNAETKPVESALRPHALFACVFGSSDALQGCELEFLYREAMKLMNEASVGQAAVHEREVLVMNPLFWVDSGSPDYHNAYWKIMTLIYKLLQRLTPLLEVEDGVPLQELCEMSLEIIKKSPIQALVQWFKGVRGANLRVVINAVQWMSEDLAISGFLKVLGAEYPGVDPNSLLKMTLPCFQFLGKHRLSHAAIGKFDTYIRGFTTTCGAAVSMEEFQTQMARKMGVDLGGAQHAFDTTSAKKANFDRYVVSGVSATCSKISRGKPITIQEFLRLLTA
jgi:hypothetical protein